MGSQLKIKKVQPLEGNIVVKASVLQDVLSVMTVCSQYEPDVSGRVALVSTGKKEGCAKFLIFRCNDCFASKTLLSVRMRFVK